jgi:hypothetical protein
VTDSLTARDRAMVLALMTLNEEVTNKVLHERLGFRIEGEARRRLNAAGLVESTKVGQAYRHALSDKGWAWCWEEMAGPAPARGDSVLRSLYAVLAGLRGYLERTNRGLADVYGTDPLESRIRAAYWKLASEPGEWAKIIEVRALLNDVSVDRLDEALQRAEQERDFHIVPETDQQTLTLADRAAAVTIGGKEKHLFRVDR